MVKAKTSYTTLSSLIGQTVIQRLVQMERRIGPEARIARYENGQHTTWLLELFRRLPTTLNIKVTYDDHPEVSPKRPGIPVRRPSRASHLRLDAIIPSSDSAECRLVAYIRRSCSPYIPIHRLYAELLPGPFPSPQHLVWGFWSRQHKSIMPFWPPWLPSRNNRISIVPVGHTRNALCGILQHVTGASALNLCGREAACLSPKAHFYGRKCGFVHYAAQKGASERIMWLFIAHPNAYFMRLHFTPRHKPSSICKPWKPVAKGQTHPLTCQATPGPFHRLRESAQS